MLFTETPRPGLLFGSFLYSDELDPDFLKKNWEDQFGECVKLIPGQNPLFQYYSKEMGENLNRFFLLTTKSFPREFLLSTKLQSITWEKRWSENHKRKVNIDIGFLTLENFVLATTKNYSHRVYLGQNIFADLTYIFQKGEFHFLPWTYPDYRDDEKVKFFELGRMFLLQKN